jgi:GT2 family glycosyltransferase
VLVPVRNGAATLPALLDSLRAQTLERDRYEVIVVDNGSRDRSGEIARAAGSTVVEEPRPNRSRARNTGAKAARGGVLAFTDADCVVSERWAEAVLRCSARKPLMAGPVEIITGNPPNAVERFEKLWRFGQEAWVRQGWAATANLAVRRAAFDTVGGFDTAYRHIGEDADFCLRAARAGFELGWCPDAWVGHHAERRLPPLLGRSFLHGYSATQCYYRVGVGERAWRRPAPALRGTTALDMLGAGSDSFEGDEPRRMLRLARLSYAARVAGSLWAELRRAR